MEDQAPPWSAYNEAQVGREPRALCRDVLARAGEGRGRLAVDLGAGAAVETTAMLAAGWRVLAVDSDAGLAERFGEVADLEVRVAAFEDVDLPQADLVHAGYALPFVGPEDFPRVWQEVRAALAPGAWLAVDLFGDRDDWAGEDGMTFVDRARVDDLLHGLDVVDLDEEERDAGAFRSDTKHWHVFHVIARQP